MSLAKGSYVALPGTTRHTHPFSGIYISGSPTTPIVSRLLLVLLGLLAFGADNAAALSQKYCSTLNTGSNFQPVSSIFQSNGACYDTCNQGNYAFAIVQGSQCWCSNYAPGTTTSVGNCDDNCPGYPAERCGSSTDNLYGYISLLRNPSGTIGGPTVTSQVSSSTHSTWTPITTVQTITGQVQTVTITPTGPPKSSAVTHQQGNNNFFSNAGRVVGLFVGLAILILLVAAGALFLCWRRRRWDKRELPPTDDTNGSTPLPHSRSRSMSELGLMEGAAAGEKQVLPRITTGMWNMSGGSGESPTGSSSNKRNSATRIVDQRLDPGAVWSPEHDNSSRVSVRSLRDDRDYSRRVLRLANPDG